MKINWSSIEPVRDETTLLRNDLPAQSAIVKLAEQQAEIERLCEENAGLREVLKPFEKAAEYCEGLDDLDYKSVLVGNLRAAAAAIREGGRGMTAEEFAAMERRARMFEAANEKMLADNKRLREENARLRKAVKNAYYEGWQDNASIDDTEDKSIDRLDAEWEYCEARAAIREGGENA